ncbi:MAG: hypothetical protein COA99_14255 [Moraxellaceae bacterium]|nr:MAG: hypothetical protein COA99_14255 [Moraxellaceae bacterium]
MNINSKIAVFRQSIALVSMVFLSTALMVSECVYANEHDGMDWQPGASEKLIRMPAKYIDATIERNFQQSSLASGIRALDAQIQLEVVRMKEAHQAVEALDGDTGERSVDARHQFLTAKSNYLGLLHEKHQLAERTLNKKAKLYQRVLDKLQHEKEKASDPVTIDLVAKQQAARARLNKTVGQVDELLSSRMSGKTSSVDDNNNKPSSFKPSKYQREYSENLAKVQKLKQAIQKHAANENPMPAGMSLNREQYVRYLLTGVDGDLALLDQERLMLGYMAKLVALDAQALEHEITYNAPDQEAKKIKQQIRLANTADLFMGL